MKNNHAVIIRVESVFIEDLIVAFVSSKAFSRQRSGTKHNNAEGIILQIEKKEESAGSLSTYIYLIMDAQLNIQNGTYISAVY